MLETIMSTLGWIGTGLVLVGYYLNANKYVSSWLTWFTGNTCILIYSCYLEAWPMVALNAFLLCMNVYGYRKWKYSDGQ